MFDSGGKPRKPEERAHARELRRAGEPYKRIASRLGVSPSSVFNWTKDIQLTDEQNWRKVPAAPRVQSTSPGGQRASAWGADATRGQHIFGAIQEYAGFEEPRWLG